MITLFFDREDKVPMYEQLYNHIRSLIQNKILNPNEKLPSKRKLSQHLKVSQITVETAYLQLKAEGYIRSNEKIGYFVEPYTSLLVSDKSPVKTTKKSTRLVEYEYDLKTNVVDPIHFPYDAWAKLERDTFLDAKHSLLNSGDPEGLYELRVQISLYLYQFRGISTKPENIIIGAGSDFLLNLLTLLIGKDKCYALESPGYPKLKKLYDAYGVHTKYISLDASGMSIESLNKEKADIVHVSPSHQYPSGIVMPISRRNQLLSWAYEKSERYIIEDDYDSEFRFSGNPIPAMQGMDSLGKVIYLNNFSKSMAPTFRVAFMVLPQSLLDIYYQKYSFFSNTVPIFEQLVLSRFLESKAFEKHLNRMKLIYKSKKDHFTKLLKESAFGNYIHFEGEEAGLHFLVLFDIIINEFLFIEKAKIEGVRVYGIQEFSPIKKEKASLVLGYGNYQLSDFKEIVLKLERAWKECHFI
jgi:GntR family transcriptional regulator/MocR family aminotransferase